MNKWVEYAIVIALGVTTSTLTVASKWGAMEQRSINIEEVVLREIDRRDEQMSHLIKNTDTIREDMGVVKERLVKLETTQSLQERYHVDIQGFK